MAFAAAVSARKTNQGLLRVETTTAILFILTACFFGLHAVNKNIDTIRKKVAIELKNQLQGKLYLDPTVRNVVNVFAVSVQVLMETLFIVSRSAINNQSRNNILDKKFEKTKNRFKLKIELQPSEEQKVIIELDGPQHFIQISNWKTPEEQFEGKVEPPVLVKSL